MRSRDILEQFPNNQLPDYDADLLGFATIAEAKEYWRRKCRIRHSDPTHRQNRTAPMASAIAESREAQAKLMYAELLTLYPSLRQDTTSSHRTGTSSSPNLLRLDMLHLPAQTETETKGWYIYLGSAQDPQDLRRYPDLYVSCSRLTLQY